MIREKNHPNFLLITLHVSPVKIPFKNSKNENDVQLTFFRKKTFSIENKSHSVGKTMPFIW